MAAMRYGQGKGGTFVGVGGAQMLTLKQTPKAMPAYTYLGDSMSAISTIVSAYESYDTVLFSTTGMLLLFAFFTAAALVKPPKMYMLSPTGTVCNEEQA